MKEGIDGKATKRVMCIDCRHFIEIGEEVRIRHTLVEVQYHHIDVAKCISFSKPKKRSGPNKTKPIRLGRHGRFSGYGQ